MVGALWTPAGSVISGGLACVAAVVAIAAAFPEIARFSRSRADQEDERA